MTKNQTPPPASARWSDIQADPGDELARSGKDAPATRRALLCAARRRFATEGYRGATVRHIAADVGVNVALINRYFGSKEGLFEACMNRTAEELDPQEATRVTAAVRPTIEEVIDRMVTHATNSPNPDDPLQLLLLLRSSGDENADQIRRRTLESYAERIAQSAGWRAGDPATEHLLLRAQIAIATMLGIVMLRASTRVQPMAAATSKDLDEPLTEVLRTLLNPAEISSTNPATRRS